MKTKLFNRDFSLVILGQIISIFGAAILRFALDFYVLELTGRADVFALVLAISVVPGIFFTPLGGAIADRVNRRNLMVIFDFSSSAVVIILMALINSGRASVVMIGIVMAALGTVSAMYQPAVQASIPVLAPAEKLASANGIASGVNALANLMAPVLGSLLYRFAGLSTLVMISGIAFFLSAVMEIFIHIPFTRVPLSKTAGAVIWGDMKDGLAYMIKKNPLILKVTILAAFVNMLATPLFIVGMPYILQIILKSNVTMLGFGMGVLQFSMIVGAVLTGVLSKKMTLVTLHKPLFMMAVLIIPMAAALTPPLLGLGYWPPFILLCAAAAAVMLLATVISVFVITGVQKETPNEMLGKVMAIVMTISNCVAPLGHALYGFVFERFNKTAYIPVLMAAGFTLAIALAAKLVAGKTIK